MPTPLIVTCEHAGNDVPPAYRRLFRGAGEILRSHRGYDPGSWELGRRIAAAMDAPLFYSTVTRLLVELNRSPHHRALFSEFTRPLDRAARERIVAEYYRPHRSAVETAIAQAVRAGGPVLHLSVHTFTPVLAGVTRQCDVGLLYDPARIPEREFCRRWQHALRQLRPGLRIRRNDPYRGAADGFTTYLRTRFPAQHYLGIELEVNQRFVAPRSPAWQSLQDDIIAALKNGIRCPDLHLAEQFGDDVAGD